MVVEWVGIGCRFRRDRRRLVRSGLRRGDDAIAIAALGFGSSGGSRAVAPAHRVGLGRGRGRYDARPMVQHADADAIGEHEFGHVERIGERVLAQRRARASVAVAADIGAGILNLHHGASEHCLGFGLDGIAQPFAQDIGHRAAEYRRRIDCHFRIVAHGAQ